jgi:hypothetical protein
LPSIHRLSHWLVCALHTAAAHSSAVLDTLVYLGAPDVLLTLAQASSSQPSTSVAALRATILLSSRPPQPPTLSRPSDVHLHASDTYVDVHAVKSQRRQYIAAAAAAFTFPVHSLAVSKPAAAAAAAAAAGSAALEVSAVRRLDAVCKHQSRSQHDLWDVYDADGMMRGKQQEPSETSRAERMQAAGGAGYDAAAFEQSSTALYSGRLEVVLHHCLAAPKRELRLMTVKVDSPSSARSLLPHCTSWCKGG